MVSFLQLKILTECGEEKDREEKDREEKDREEKDREYLHQLDYLFHDLIPLLTDLFKKKSTAVSLAGYCIRVTKRMFIF